MLGVLALESSAKDLGDLATVASFVVAMVTILDMGRRSRLDSLLSY